jgi:hypothetical protein
LCAEYVRFYVREAERAGRVLSQGQSLSLDAILFRAFVNRQFSLHKCVSIGYTSDVMGKDVGLRIRLERALRDEFLEACRAQDRPAAQVLREFMREYVAKREAAYDDGQRNNETRAASVRPKSG